MATLRFETNAFAFAAALRALPPRVRVRAHEVMLGEAQDFLRTVRLRTPVLTSRLRNSIHLVAFGAADVYSYTDNRGQTFDGHLADPVKRNEIVVGTNVPYALAVESGSSRKAPLGMFAVTEIEKSVDLQQSMGEVVKDLWT